VVWSFSFRASTNTKPQLGAGVKKLSQYKTGINLGRELSRRHLLSVARNILSWLMPAWKILLLEYNLVWETLLKLQPVTSPLS
jgi:hypothetical protein